MGKRYPKVNIIFPVYDIKPTMNSIQVLDLKSKEITTYSSKADIVKATGLGKSSVTKCLKIGPTYNMLGYAIRKTVDTEWPEVVVREGSKNIIVKLRELKTGKELEFDSLRKAAGYLSVDRNTVQKAKGSGKDLNGYVIS